MNKQELVEYIQRVIDEEYNGVQAALARDCGISSAYLNDVLNNRRDPGQKLLNALGVERIVIYRFKE